MEAEIGHIKSKLDTLTRESGEIKDKAIRHDRIVETILYILMLFDSLRGISTFVASGNHTSARAALNDLTEALSTVLQDSPHYVTALLRIFPEYQEYRNQLYRDNPWGENLPSNQATMRSAVEELLDDGGEGEDVIGDLDGL